MSLDCCYDLWRCRNFSYFMLHLTLIWVLSILTLQSHLKPCKLEQADDGQHVESYKIGDKQTLGF